MARKSKKVFAVWECKELPEDLGEFHVSAGADDDDQGDGYFHDDKGASLNITSITGREDVSFRVELTSPARNIQRYKDYWLSPNQIDTAPGTGDAIDFGIN